MTSDLSDLATSDFFDATLADFDSLTTSLPESGIARDSRPQALPLSSSNPSSFSEEFP